MTRPTILLDCDGVLADFCGLTLKRANYLYGCAVSPQDLTDYDVELKYPQQYRDRFWNDILQPGFCQSIQRYTGALQAVEKLREIGDVLALTSPRYLQWWYQERLNWLKNEFGFAFKDVLQVASKRKPLVRGDVFVDDKLETAIGYAVANPLTSVFLWDAPYNQTPCLPGNVTRTRDWELVVLAAREFAA